MIGAPAPSPASKLRDAHRMLAQSPWAPDVVVGGSRVGDLLARIAIFDVDGGRAIAANQPAAAMADAVDGARALRRVEAALAAASANQPAATPTVVAFSSGPSAPGYVWDSPIDPVAMGTGGGHQAFAVLRFIDLISAMPRSVVGELEVALSAPTADPRWAAQLVQGIEASLDPHLAAQVTDDNAVMFAPSATAILAAAAPGTTGPSRTSRWIAEVVDHELHHATTPAMGDDVLASGLDWLEEGVSELLSRWPGAAETMAAAMGLPAPTPASRLRPGSDDYDRYTAVARRLAALAGLDIDRPEQLDAARSLFQGHRLVDLPDVLARTIAERRGMSPAAIPSLRELLAGSAGRLDRVAAIERYVGEGSSSAAAIS